MKTLFAFIVFCLISFLSFSQGSENHPEAELHVYNGLKMEEKEDWEGALKEYTQAIKIDEDYAEAYFYRGLLLINHGEAELKPYGCSDLEMAIFYGYTPAGSFHYSLCFQ